MATTRSKDITLYYDVYGDGAPVLLIMGLGGDLHLWARQVPALAARHRTIVFDNRGSGRSEKPAGPYAIAGMADDTLAVLDAAGASRAHVVGYSMGGLIAQELCRRAPERVASLVLYATYARPHQTTRDIVASMIAESGGDLIAALKALTSRVYSNDFVLRELDWLKAWTRRALRDGLAFAGLRAQAEASLDHDATAWLGDAVDRTDVPALLLTGDADRLIPATQTDELAALLPRAQVVRIPGGSHGVQLERPDAWNAAVLEFFARHTAPARTT